MTEGSSGRLEPGNSAPREDPERSFAERNGFGAFVAIVVGCLAVSVVGWLPLRLPPYLLGLVIPRSGCRSVKPGTPAMYVCGTKSALLLLAAPFVFSLILFLFRRQVGVALRKRVIPRVSPDWKFLAAPLIATGLFAMSWSYAYSKRWDRIGFLPEICFPVMLGLFTYLTARYASSIQRRLRRFLALRDHLRPWMRLVAAIALPSVVALVLARLLLTNRTVTAPTGGGIRPDLLVQQLLVIVSIVLGYLCLIPQAGSLVEAVKETLGLPKRTGTA